MYHFFSHLAYYFALKKETGTTEMFIPISSKSHGIAAQIVMVIVISGRNFVMILEESAASSGWKVMATSPQKKKKDGICEECNARLRDED
jgi:hypothetical protein